MDSAAPFRTIALDGGAASGKSSTARLLAARRHFLHIDTGSHYRAVTATALEAGLEPVENPALGSVLAALQLETEVQDHTGMLRLNGSVPADSQLRSEAVNHSVSKFAALPMVREAVKRYQRAQPEFARAAGFAGLIMDGRDIGTVILPQADLKVFLEADEATRAARRQGEGQSDAIAARDKLDSSRRAAPLQAAPDALRIDNSDLSLEEVVDLLEARLTALD